jgi:hypothetical protein
MKKKFLAGKNAIYRRFHRKKKAGDDDLERSSLKFPILLTVTMGGRVDFFRDRRDAISTAGRLGHAMMILRRF